MWHLHLLHQSVSHCHLTLAQVILFSTACLTCSSLCGEVSSFRLCSPARQERAKGCKKCLQVPSSRGTSEQEALTHQGGCGPDHIPACRELARHREIPALTQSQARGLCAAGLHEHVRWKWLWVKTGDWRSSRDHRSGRPVWFMSLEGSALGMDSGECSSSPCNTIHTFCTPQTVSLQAPWQTLPPSWFSASWGTEGVPTCAHSGLEWLFADSPESAPGRSHWPHSKGFHQQQKLLPALGSLQSPVFLERKE